MSYYQHLLSNITWYLSLLYPLLYLWKFKKNNRAFKIFTIYLVGIGVIQYLLYAIHEAGYPSNLFLFHYYFIFQFVMLSLFYKILLGYKWIYVVMAAALVFFGIQYINDPGLYFIYNPIGAAVSQSILVLFALLYFYQSLSGKKEFILINTGILFYMVSSILIFASGNMVLNASRGTAVLFVDINRLLYLIFQILIISEWVKNYSEFTLKNKLPWKK